MYLAESSDREVAKPSRETAREVTLQLPPDYSISEAIPFT